MAFKAAIRAGALTSVGKGKGRGSIAAAESHAKREDPVAKRRSVRASPPVAWSKAEAMPSFLGSGPLDYVAAFAAHKRETGAGERKRAALAMEFKAVVSPEWLAEGGADPRDPNNPRVQQLVAEAQAWAESWGGKGAVWAVRYDTDEKGAGVVDLFMSPVRQQRHKSGKAKPVISCRKAKDELLASERKHDSALKTSGAAMQSSWARWCQQRLDARIERGQPKEATGREHIHADVYAAEADAAKAAAQADLQRLRQEQSDLAQAHAEATGALHSATERLQEAQRQAETLEATVAPLRAAVAALDAFHAQQDAYEAYDHSAAQDVFRVTDTELREGRWITSSHYAEPSVSVRAENHLTGHESSWSFPNKGEKSEGMNLHKAFQAAKRAGADFWVRVTGWKQASHMSNSEPTGLSTTDAPPEPPKKPTIAREVLRLLSRLDDRTLAAVRDLEAEERPLQPQFGVKW